MLLRPEDQNRTKNPRNLGQRVFTESSLKNVGRAPNISVGGHRLCIYRSRKESFLLNSAGSEAKEIRSRIRWLLRLHRKEELVTISTTKEMALLTAYQFRMLKENKRELQTANNK